MRYFSAVKGVEGGGGGLGWGPLARCNHTPLPANAPLRFQTRMLPLPIVLRKLSRCVPPMLPMTTTCGATQG